MKAVLSLLLVAANILLSQAALSQWVLQYTGYCDTNVTDSYRKCYGKAQSEDMAARINSDAGVTFEITQSYIGPISQLYIIETYVNDEDFNAVGNMTFGVHMSQENALSVIFTSDDIHAFYDDDGNIASIGRAVIDSGNGAFDGVTGELTMNTIATQNADKPEIMDWTAILVGNLVL